MNVTFAVACNFSVTILQTACWVSSAKSCEFRYLALDKCRQNRVARRSLISVSALEDWSEKTGASYPIWFYVFGLSVEG